GAMLAILLRSAHVPNSLALSLVILLMFVEMVFIPHIYLMRMLKPLLTGLPRSDRSMTLRDQFRRLAAAMPLWLLVVAGSGGILMVLGGMLTIADAVMEGRTGARLYGTAFTMGMGLVFAAYFFGL